MQNTGVIDGLNGLLADATVLYQKLRHYHWNASGREFFTLHERFEELYTAWAASIDEVAERILMVGGTPLHTLRGVLQVASLQEDESIPAGTEMVAALLADLNAVLTRMADVTALAEAAGDRGTTSLLDELRAGIEKDVWMLNAWRKEAAAWA